MPQSLRHYSWLDQVLINIDQGLQTLTTTQRIAQRPYPAQKADDITLNEQEREHSAGLMRVNHAGEICAQALYQWQALLAKSENVREKMNQAALEEVDHLAWCEQRLTELKSHTSYLNPIWYLGSLLLGVLAGLIGDRWSLGFIVETERQVVKHLTEHLQRLPEHDIKSQFVLEQMREDEAHHATVALDAGGIELPGIIKIMMACASKIMTKTTYYL